MYFDNTGCIVGHGVGSAANQPEDSGDTSDDTLPSEAVTKVVFVSAETKVDDRTSSLKMTFGISDCT